MSSDADSSGGLPRWIENSWIYVALGFCVTFLYAAFRIHTGDMATGNLLLLAVVLAVLYVPMVYVTDAVGEATERVIARVR